MGISVRPLICAGLSVACAILCGCSKEPILSEPERLSLIREHDDAIPELRRLSPTIEHSIWYRDDEFPTLRVLSYAPEDVTVESLRALLLDLQPEIEEYMRIARLIEGSLPTPVEYTDSEISADAHLSGVSGRAMNATRALLADAARQFDEGDHDGVCDRFIACFRFAFFFLGQSHEEHRGRGMLLYAVAQSELRRLLDHAGDNFLDPSCKDELLDLLKRIWERRMVYTSHQQAVFEVPYRRMIERLESGD